MNSKVREYMEDESGKEVYFCPEINKDYGNFRFFEVENAVNQKDLCVRTGKKAVYDIISYTDFINGISKIKLSNGECFLMDLDGNISKRFDYVGKFYNGYAISKIGGRIKFVDYEFNVSKKYYLESDLSFDSKGFIYVSDGDSGYYLDKYLSVCKRKWEVVEMLKQSPMNYRNIPTSYFENKAAIKEFLNICKEYYIKESQQTTKELMRFKLKSFINMVKEKNNKEKEIIKQRRQRDEKYNLFLSENIEKIYKFMDLEQNSTVDNAFNKIEF